MLKLICMRLLLILLSIGFCSLIIVLSGCMTGIGAKSKFNCNAPQGVSCESVSGVYTNSLANNLPSQQVNSEQIDKQLTRRQKRNLPNKNNSYINNFDKPLTSGEPIHSAITISRVWLAPWEDLDGDLHDQNIVYMILDKGHWNMAHESNMIEKNYMPTFLRKASSSTKPTTPKKTINKNDQQSTKNLDNSNQSGLSGMFQDSTKIINVENMPQETSTISK